MPRAWRVLVEGVPFARDSARFTRDFDDLVAWLATTTDKTATCRLTRIDWKTIGRIITRVGEEMLAAEDRLTDPFRDLDRRGRVAQRDTGTSRWSAITAAGAWCGAARARGRPLPMSSSQSSTPICTSPFPSQNRQNQPKSWKNRPIRRPPKRTAADSDRPVGERAGQLTAVSMDMGEGYAKSVREHAPQAVICIDNFHVVQLATKALDEVRREHWNVLRATGDTGAAKAFKDSRWSLLKNPADLTDTQVDTLAAIHATGGKVPRAWAMKEMVRAIFAPNLTLDTVDELIDRLLARLSRSRPKPFIRLGRTIRKHRDGILAAHRLKLSNARAEAMNNRVKLIVRRAYGFHSAQAALALIHLTCGPVTLTLPHEQAFA